MNKEDNLLNMVQRIRNNNERQTLVQLELDSMRDQLTKDISEFSLWFQNGLDKTNKYDTK